MWHEDEDTCARMLNEFYSWLFTSSQPHDLDRILDGVVEVVTDGMRADLAWPYTSEEVDVAIKEMAHLKAPSSDGMPPLFFQTYWTDIGIPPGSLILPKFRLIVQGRRVLWLSRWI